MKTKQNEEERRFRLIVDSLPVLVWFGDNNGNAVWANRGWLEFSGRTFTDEVSASAEEIFHPEDFLEWSRKYKESLADGSEFRMEFRLRRHDGIYRWMLGHVFPTQLVNLEGSRAICSCIDITDQVCARQSLEQQQVLLEISVEQRADELRESNERMRLVERMAALGSLSAGLGHDMGNLLMPVRVRLDALAQAGLSPECAEHVRVIRSSVEYLQRLSNGLRLLALDPSYKGSNERTELLAWWRDAEPLLKNALPRGITLESQLPQTERWVAISRASLTQAVFNLVQNAGNAMRRRGIGLVIFWTRAEDDVVQIGVSDNGPGMSEEVKRRCVEPYFTTKARGISTGLGLSLVYKLVSEIGGTMIVESVEGEGSTFILNLPRAKLPMQTEKSDGQRPLVVVSLADARIRAFVAAELRQLGLDLRSDIDSHPQACFVIADTLPADFPSTQHKKVIFLGKATELVSVNGFYAVLEQPSLRDVRDAIRRAASDQR